HHWRADAAGCCPDRGVALQIRYEEAGSGRGRKGTEGAARQGGERAGRTEKQGPEGGPVNPAQAREPGGCPQEFWSQKGRPDGRRPRFRSPALSFHHDVCFRAKWSLQRRPSHFKSQAPNGITT